MELKYGRLGDGASSLQLNDGDYINVFGLLIKVGARGSQVVERVPPCAVVHRLTTSKVAEGNMHFSLDFCNAGAVRRSEIEIVARMLAESEK